jgi:hypothetical protein
LRAAKGTGGESGYWATTAKNRLSQSGARAY